MPGMLLPLWVLISLFGFNLGLTDQQVEGKYVYYSAEVRMMPDGARVYAGYACDRRLFVSDPQSQESMCGGLPDGTAMLFSRVTALYGGEPYELATLRHETEHLLRGEDGPTHDLYNEAAADAAACAVSPHGWWCGTGEVPYVTMDMLISE